MSKLFCTDYYQLSMVSAYMLCDRANDIAGFEAFVRKINPLTNIYGTHYEIDNDAYHSVTQFIYQIKYELETKKEELFNLFWAIIKKDLENGENLRSQWMDLDIEFEFNLLEPNSVIKPYMPIFQYKGPRWLGQLLETPILLLLNSQIGLNTFKKFGDDDLGSTLYHKLTAIVYPMGNSTYQHYLETVKQKLNKYRRILPTEILLLEAGFRRAPSYKAAVDVAKNAILCGWNGTSNVGAYIDGGLAIEKIGGSCAHSYVMSFEDEMEAFKTWMKIFPNSTLLIDTYDTLQAAKNLVKEGLKPKCIRIDSEPLDELTKEVRTIFDNADWKDVQIFISGDLTPKRLKKFVEQGIPFNRCMAGTKLVNIDGAERINAGMVYKLVEYEKNGHIYRPQKYSQGKESIGGLKKIVTNESSYWFVNGKKFSENFAEVKNIKPTMEKRS